jgi:organic radical activating enzyme
VYPQARGAPERYADLAFENFFLQPMDSPAREEHTHAAIAYCMRHPNWRLSLQTHKLLGLR